MSLPPWWEQVVLAAFLFLLFGYALGRRQGRHDGFLEGLRYAPLELRRLSWEKGACVICGAWRQERLAARVHAKAAQAPPASPQPGGMAPTPLASANPAGTAGSGESEGGGEETVPEADANGRDPSP